MLQTPDSIVTEAGEGLQDKTQMALEAFRVWWKGSHAVRTPRLHANSRPPAATQGNWALAAMSTDMVISER